MDPILLARLQFALNISFHILFPAITIALCWVLLAFKVFYNKTHDEKWMEAYRFWVKIFALCFALGIVSGVTMSFQFGTNWPGFMKTVGNIAGPLLAYEVLTAFFLEATFLGIMLFGMHKVSNRLHTLSIFLVAAGTTLSAFWILVLNSWMHTPSGFEMINGQAHAISWSDIIFNPSMPYRMLHMLLASGLTAAFLIAGISSYQILKGTRHASAQATLKFGIYMGAVLIPLQIWIGDLHGLNTLKHQPAKIAAMEGLWETQQGAPLLLFAFPDEHKRQNRFEISIPKGASLILTHDRNGEVKGLNDFGLEHPPVSPLFFGFRIMVGVGFLMFLLSWIGAYQVRRGFFHPWVMRCFVFMSFSGWVATLAGWYVTEIGRQPYLVQGLLKTIDAVSDVPTTKLGVTFSLYGILYAVLIVAFISTIFYLARKPSSETLSQGA